MLAQLFSRHKDIPAKAPPSTGDRLVYAIGDIHGCAERFAQMLDRIRQDWADLGCPERPILVLLGDYVDRGPASDLVLDLCCALRAASEFDVRALRGNHEDTLLEFLARPQVGPAWCQYGGRQTLGAYGVEAPAADADETAWTAVRDAIDQNLPRAHHAFLRELELMTSVGDYVFVHAGVDPERPLDQQDDEDLLWIRDRFLRSDRRLDKVVVHGHTPALEAALKPERIGLDTGAYVTGVLSAVRLRGTDQTLLQARGVPA